VTTRRALLRAAIGWSIAVALAPAQAQDPQATAAVAAARDWLLMTDHGDAAESHKRAGARFRAAMKVSEWQAALARERLPRGSVAQRTVVQTAFQRGVPGAPDAEIALLQFRTSFAKQADAGETVTLEREADGAWRVVGYFIR
jgi:hypothetical protein